ncbi:MAG TPA: ROK family protein [Candidatus Paceibacterota bacterium]|nr:ROK family protein [Verrucomicrobiota bacterium]HRZ46429.1 ROK family protein [Candidatus Paceibacterota bacterium]HRZ93421.1 ROK family protein [Candidatus Paceibacterota bacterium]
MISSPKQSDSGSRTGGPAIAAPLDPGFQPAVVAAREYARQASQAPRPDRIDIALERERGLVARHTIPILPPGQAAMDDRTFRHVERTIKFMLWAWGGWRLFLAGPAWLCERIARCYQPDGARAFDADLMTRVYEKPFTVQQVEMAGLPPARESTLAIGGHLDGCRIGFDLGASDYKLAAVANGEAVFSAEIPWNPKDQSDPQYHYQRIQEGLKQAAAHLPRVDAIGGSSAGVFVDNQVMVASLFRSVPKAEFDRAVKPMFRRLGREWNVPLVVINDGDVTALAGAMSLQKTAMLGVAMGSSQAAGYLDRQGRITGWLNELAFAPVDFNPNAPPDEWSGDGGVGALYFSQQAVNKLLPAAGIDAPAEAALPERLKMVQDLMAKNDPRARAVFETIGVYLGYAIPYYREFYDFDNLLILGRVTSGPGGDIILERARAVLNGSFAELAARIELHVPDEKSRRIGQAVAAASLPEIQTPSHQSR